MKKLNGSISWINVSIIPVVGFISLIAFLPLACKKNFPCEGCGGMGPVAEAGAGRVFVLPRDAVHLDGRLSHDSSGKIPAYTWTKISGPSSLNIENATTAKP